jgi:hypothetical protein
MPFTAAATATASAGAVLTSSGPFRFTATATAVVTASCSVTVGGVLTPQQIAKGQPTAYTVGAGPSCDPSSPVYLQNQLRALSATLEQMRQMTPQPATKAPASPVNGMHRLACAPWRPVVGQTTDRWVTYYSGNWIYSNSM